MSSTFWSNTIWYVLLGITTIIELILIFIKVKYPKLVLAMFITITGVVFAFEMSIAGFHAYEYSPKIIPQSPYDDSVAGNYFSQYSVSATALLIAVYGLKNHWYVLFAAAYAIIEDLFVKLEIYKQYWYKTWMTVIGLLILFWIVKKIYESSSEHIGRIWLYIYIYFGLTSLHVNTMWLARVLGIHSFGSAPFSANAMKYGVFISGGYMLIVGITIMAIYFSKIRWWWRAVVILLLYIIHYIAYKLGLMYYTKGWFLPFTTIAIFSMYLYTYILDKLYGQNEKEIQSRE